MADKLTRTPEQAAQDQQRQAAAEQAQAEADRGGRRLDETTPGGRYLLDDGETLVDADGKPVKGKQ
jgi:glutathione S-transferase